jgi:transglutaminase-like putative cysteine protease
MKKSYSVIRNIFAVIGVLAIITFIIGWIIYPNYDIYIEKSGLSKFDERVELLKTSGTYASDTASFEMTIVQNEARAKEIRDYFQLDTLYPANATTWEKALAIGKFVSSNIPHANQKKWPNHINAIGLWEYTKEVEPAFNCRLHSILTFELLLAADIKARYITCMPEDEDDMDCHVVNEVWLPELNKWAMIDTDSGGNYISDLDGTPLSLKEIREHYIADAKILTHKYFGEGSKKKDWYYSYMAKNTYWFASWGTLTYYQEDYKNNKDVNRDSYVILVPSGYKPFNVGDGDTVTTDAEKFWDATLMR